MTEEHKKPGCDQAFGETIASIPAVRSLIGGAAQKLREGESDDSVLSWLVESAGGETNDLERAFGVDRRFAGWVLDSAKTGRPAPFFAEVRGSVLSWHMLDTSGAFIHDKWAVVDGLRTRAR